MKFWVGACALLVGLAGCSGKGPNTDFAELRGAAATKSAAGQLPKLQLGRTAAQSVANAPDRGALVSYQNKGVPTKREGAYTWYPVAISEEHALKAVVTGEMTVPSPDGSQVKLRYERHEEHPDGNWTWVGRVEGGDPNQEAILTFGEKAVYGSIPQANGAAPLSLQTRNGVLWAVETDLSKVKNPNTSNDMMVPPALALREAVAAKATPSAVTQAAVAANAPATSANTIDVAIGYTQGFAAAHGGASAAVTRLTYLIQVGNQAFTNSKINGYLRLVNAVQVTYADNTKNSDTLHQLTGHNGTSVVSVPAALAPIRTARDQSGADLAVLVRKFQTPENDGCGIAWLNGANQRPIDPALDDDFGFAVISDGNDTGTDGNGYFCAEETLVHELAHLMGSAHDRDNSKINPDLPASGTNLQYGRYAYSFGMKTDSANGNFYTIMAYGDNNQAFYRTFSNPLVVSCGPSNNLACGVTDQTDNARSLNQTIPVVATFRAMVVPIASAMDLYGINKVGGSNKTEVFGMGSSNNFGSFILGASTGLYATGTDRSWAFKFGDYNSDGISDLYAILKAGSSAYTEIYVLNGANNYTTMLFSGATVLGRSGSDNRWMFKVGDYNKDGRLDIYAIQRMGASGRTEVHILNGADNFKTFLANVATALYATGIDNSWEYELGDYNGDGTLDIYSVLKTGGSGKTEVHVLNGADNFQSYLLNIPTVLYQTGNINIWNFKVGDFNRDGVHDIYAINKTGANNRTEVFVMDGANRFQSYLFGGPTAIYATGSDVSWEFELVPARQ